MALWARPDVLTFSIEPLDARLTGRRRLSTP